MSEKLRSGYTTGTHATATLLGCLSEYFYGDVVETFSVKLPKEIVAEIEVQRESAFCFSSVKGDNDDMDVTKGAIISCSLSQTPPQNLKEQHPTLLCIRNLKLYVWAGCGVGVVSKKGLKIAPTYPAINPTPLEMMRENALAFLGEREATLHATFGVVDGEKIAKNTANAKVGVLGGISILGTRGIVKPVSASAYIDSIETEIDVAAAFDSSIIIFTLGNSALDFAKEHFNETSIIEIGNFVYDASERLQKHHFSKLVFITSVAKMSKVAQGFKNTHNKFGSIDFEKIRIWLREDLNYTLKEEEFLTLKGVLETLPQNVAEDFVKVLSKKAATKLQQWCKELKMKEIDIEVITLTNKLHFTPTP